MVVAFTDMQGRLQGKRLHAAYFVDHVLEHGTEGCNYLLAVDIDMNTVDGYALTSWEQGYGDLEFALDLDTIRLLPHLPGTALIQCDLVRLDHGPVEPSPRTILKRQLAALAEDSYVALAGTELEFLIFSDSYEDAWNADYRGLTPANQYNIDYSVLGTSRVEPLLRDLRNTLYGAGLDVESAKGECNLGQHEIGFLYADALITADNHAVYKTVAKEVAAARGQSITFMAKYDEREGNSCHIHLSLRGSDGSIVFWDSRPEPSTSSGQALSKGRQTQGARPCTTTSWPACWPRWPTSPCSTRRTSTPTSASPRVPSPRRPSAGARTTAPAPSASSGAGPSARLENRVPGGDVNPYLALAAMIAGGRHGIAAAAGVAAAVGRQRVHLRSAPDSALSQAAREAFAASAVAREAFGDEVVDHYTNMADVELQAYAAAVTDWERRRGFERM